MGLLEKLSDIVNSTGKELNKKAKDLVSSSKLEGQIAVEEEKIHNTYLQIGTEYYEAHHDDPQNPFAEDCKQIEESKALIANLQKELEKLKGLQRCPGCGAAVTIEASFCPTCGTKMPEVKAETGADTAEETVQQTADEVEIDLQKAAEEAKSAVSEAAEQADEASKTE